MFCQMVNKIDLFKRPIYLHFNFLEKNSSRLGLLFSFAIYALVILQFVNSDIFHHLSPKVIDQPITGLFRKNLTFENKVFTVSIVDDNSLAYADPSIFKLIAKDVWMSSNDVGGYDFNKIEYNELHLCTSADFPSDPNVFDNLGLNNSYCLDKNRFQMEGYWDEPKLTYFSFELYLCNNLTSSVVCKTPDEINEFFVMKYFNLIYADLKIDVKNYTNPIASKYRNDYKLVEPSLNKMMNIFLKEVSIETEDGLIFSHQAEVHDIAFDYSETDFSFIHNNVSAAIFTCDFYSSRIVQTIDRTYENISEVFANIGGLLSFLMLLGFLLTYIENTFCLTIKIMNRLYSFQPEIQVKNFPPGDDKKYVSQNTLDKSPPRNQISSLENINEKKLLEPMNNENKNNNVQIQMSTVSLDQQPSLSNVNKTPCFIQQKKIEDEDPIQEMSPEKLMNTAKDEIPSLKKINDTIIPSLLDTDKDMKKSGMTFSSKSNKKILRKSTSVGNMILNYSRKSEIISDFRKFQDQNKNSLKVSIWEYIKFKIHKICRCCTKGFKENLFMKAERIYEDEVDIVNILRRLQEIEKLKLVLLNERQISLFNLLAKPMIYIDKKKDYESEYGGYYYSEVLSATNKPQNLKNALDYYEKQSAEGKLSEIDRRLFNFVDQNIKEFKNYFDTNQ